MGGGRCRTQALSWFAYVERDCEGEFLGDGIRDFLVWLSVS